MEIRENRPYLNLRFNKVKGEYELYVAVHLPPNLSAVGLKAIGDVNHNRKTMDGFKLEIDEIPNNAPCGIFFLAEKGIAKGKNPQIVVKRVGINGVILPNPDEGGVANYEDPDGDF